MVSGWYAFFRVALRWIGRVLTRCRVSGRSHIPREGPFILVANHESILDPLLIQTNCRRTVHFFAKSTQFGANAVFRWFLPRVAAIPARRYRVDPQSVRTALRALERGDGVGIYLEGERSWEGALRPFRRGSIRLILKAGVPVVPCHVSGTYDAWPRWTRSRWRSTVHVRYGEPLHFGVHETRGARESALEPAADRLRQALLALAGERPDRPWPTGA
ncbi:MAG: 1-acyl-sn-glycerol-3-phosphate acyltransferase [Gemmatimonadetes bacterium]|nr:lysophospholipid acyltransferase family protein [Gemmatimonadota bacterium]MYA43429.1 1-acyl-sn-glycerol-3-phosphate acyltransferase [Gemmatimonadota bacterium]MYE92092.1 1-acyl-sn-glycerol-3-phosphate acyltransferase [Gemmatimonadota bacterium]MYJ08831.1 1-acyl-sn-glycerol-3-phosphate acyltransferase [Gemmatimonadota bacterium]